jgi:uncharacterized RDD family membrane protein YckC
MKAYQIKVVDIKTKNHITLTQAIIRYFVFLVTAISLFGLFVPFFRKDKKTIFDLASSTIVVDEDKP